MKSKVRLIIILYVFLMFLGQLTSWAQNGNKPQSLPDLELKLQNNETVKLSALKGKVVLLDFWYRGCAPCLMAIPDLIMLQEEFKDDLVIIGMNDYDIQEDASDYFIYKKANYRSTYKTNERLSKLFNVTEYPTTILYDTDGNLIRASSGFSKGEMKSLRRAIKRALK